MSPEPKYCILLLATREVLRRHCSLREAAAWLATYNQIMQGVGPLPVIAEEEEPAQPLPQACRI